jgi:hypothetical protein
MAPQAEPQQLPSTSAVPAKELAQLMTERAVDAVAARAPRGEDWFVAALRVAGPQLLVISASYPEPSLLEARIAAGDYRYVYAELQGAATLGERFFVHDMQGDGLKCVKETDAALDIVYINGVMSLRCDGKWSEQGLTQSDYEARFAAADQRYAAMLKALAGQLRTAK